MTDPRDRILDYALERALRDEDDASIDQAEAIAGAWERGVRGSVVCKRESGTPEAEGDPSARPKGTNGQTHSAPRASGPRPVGRSAARERSAADPATRPAARPRIWSGPLGAAAAALVLVAGGVFLWRGAGDGAEGEQGPAGGPQVADAGPGVSLSGGSIALLRDDRIASGIVPAGAEPVALEPGTTFWVQPGPAARLALEQGATFDIAPRSLARLAQLADGSRVELEWGEARATSPRAARVAFRAADVDVELDPGAHVEVRATFDRERPAPTGVASFAALAAELEGAPLGWLEVSVHDGRARIAIDGTLTVLGADEVAYVALGETPELVPRDEIEELVKLVGLFSGSFPYPETTGMECARRLEERPALWIPLTEELLASFRSEDTPWRWRQELIDILSLDPRETPLRIAREAWRVDPRPFTQNQIVALGERGVYEFETEVHATLTWYDTAADEIDPLPAALYLAVRGDDRGVEHLMRAAAMFEDGSSPETPKAVGREAVPRALASAAALARLGNREHWDHVRAWMPDAFDMSIEIGQYDAGLGLVVMFESIQGIADGAQTPLVGQLQGRLERRIARRAGDFENEDSLRAHLAELLGE
ncbi:MAG: hypothetical protein GY711_14130 [bacterium]|nr:hypothetical protein [bacterium]